MPISKEMRARYPADWRTRSRFVRFVRGRGRCEWCGAKHGEPHPRTGSVVILTTAHVFDPAPEVAHLLNLAGLCQCCHLNHDRPHHIQQRRKNRLAASGQLALLF